MMPKPASDRALEYPAFGSAIPFPASPAEQRRAIRVPRLPCGGTPTGIAGSQAAIAGMEETISRRHDDTAGRIGALQGPTTSEPAAIASPADRDSPERYGVVRPSSLPRRRKRSRCPMPNPVRRSWRRASDAGDRRSPAARRKRRKPAPLPLADPRPARQAPFPHSPEKRVARPRPVQSSIARSAAALRVSIHAGSAPKRASRRASNDRASPSPAAAAEAASR